MSGDRQAVHWLAVTRVGMAALLALGIFALDVLSPLQGAVAVLYTVVVLVVAREQRRALVHAAGVICAALAIVAYWISHGAEGFGSPTLRLGVSLVAVGTTALLCARQVTAAAQRRRSDARYGTIFSASNADSRFQAGAGERNVAQPGGGDRVGNHR